MKFRTRNINNVTSIYLAGRLDIFEAEITENNIFSTVKEHDKNHAILVLEDVEYLNSSTLRIFVSLKRYLEKRGNILILCNQSNTAVDVFFRIVNIKDMFIIYETEDEAISYLSNIKAAPSMIA